MLQNVLSSETVLDYSLSSTGDYKPHDSVVQCDSTFWPSKNPYEINMLLVKSGIVRAARINNLQYSQ